MSVKIWDSASQAFTEPQNVPRRYDTESGAWADTTGKAYSQTDAAWTERWGAGFAVVRKGLPKLPYHLATYNDANGNNGYYAMEFEQLDDGMKMASSSKHSAVSACVIFDSKIDFSNFSKMKIKYEISFTNIDSAWGAGDLFFPLIPSNNLNAEQVQLVDYPNKIITLSKVPISGEFTKELDISNITGSFYVCLYVRIYYVINWVIFKDITLE